MKSAPTYGGEQAETTNPAQAYRQKEGKTLETQPRLCPITNQPLPQSDQRAVISQKAADDFRIDCNNLAGQVLAAELVARDPATIGSEVRSQPRSKAPINVDLLSDIIEATSSIQQWAADLAYNTMPGAHLIPGDWQTVQAILQQADLVHYEPAADLIQAVTWALKKLGRIAEPPGIPELYGADFLHKYEQVKNSWMTLHNACEAVRMYTGKRLPASTARTWKQLGKVRAEGDPPKYLIADLLAMQERSHREDQTCSTAASAKR